jgi:hypothetical protein
VALLSTPAWAQTQRDRGERLGRFLDVAASQGESDRAVAAVVHGAMALVLVPPGVLLATRSDAGLQVAGATLLVRGWLEALDLGYALLPSSPEWLHDHYAGRLAQGETAAVAAEETEHEWRNVMDNEHGKRGLLGELEVSVGAAQVAGGMLLMLDGDAVPSWSQQERTLWGVVLAGVGLQGLSAGLWRLLGTSRLDELWALYESGRPVAYARQLRPSLAVMPLARGAAATIGLSF